MGIRELLFEQGLQQGFEQGILQERERQLELRKALIKKLMATGQFTRTEIARLFDVKLHLVHELENS